MKEFGGGSSSGGGNNSGTQGNGGRSNWEPGERWGQEKRGKPDSPPLASQDEPPGLVLGPEKVNIILIIKILCNNNYLTFIYSEELMILVNVSVRKMMVLC